MQIFSLTLFHFYWYLLALYQVVKQVTKHVDVIITRNKRNIDFYQDKAQTRILSCGASPLTRSFNAILDQGSKVG